MKLRKRDFLILAIGSVCLMVYTYHYFFLSNTPLYNAVSYTIPSILILNSILLPVSFLSRLRFLWLLPFLLLVYSSRILPRLVTYNLTRTESPTASSIRVLSYNVGTFNLDRFHGVDSIRLSDSTIIARQQQFLKKCDADVICLQEFYNNDASDFSTTLNEMTEMGYKYFYMNPIRIEGYGGFFGVITFSKLPIVGKGQVSFEYKENKRALNTAIYTDVLVDNDTVRVVNVHLHSMDLRVQRVLKSLPSDTLTKELDLFKYKMEYGFIKRGEQVQQIEEEVLKKAGYKILAGDLNDIPYSFSYRTIEKYLYNSFEKGGIGFGFTYNKFPWFIRIDNQFYSPEMQINSFEVLKENKLSDHYPILATYSFKRQGYSGK